MRLFKIDNKGKLRIWEAININNTIFISHGEIVGKKTEQKETITKGLAGRTIQEQIQSRVLSRIDKQLAKGYRYTIIEAEEMKGKNELNLYAPMLAQQRDKASSFSYDGAVLQRKLDGNRMLVTKQNGVIQAYTRNGKEVTTLSHILDDLQHMEEGQTLDGEVYIHGMPLKDIGSRMRREQPGTLDLKYHIYDTIVDDSYCHRMQPIINGEYGSSIVIEPFQLYTDEDAEQKFFLQIRQEGYEGLILRLGGYGYEVGKRSKGLLKIKHRFDSEYPVVGVKTSKDGKGILILRLPSGDTVKCVAPGSNAEKEHVVAHPEYYVGKLVTVSYAYMTEFGIPFHAVAERYRDE